MLAERRRDRVRRETYAEIKDLARRQMAADGAAALSLRNIAGRMGLTTPALYRYFDNRDALVTALIVDAYADLGAALAAADAGRPRDDVAGRLWALLLAYRAWAVAHPADYALILGNPIPGYHAPEETRPIVRRAFAPFLEALRDAWARGALTGFPAAGGGGEGGDLPPALARQLAAWQRAQGSALPPAVTELGLTVWGTIHGLVSLELFNHLQPIVGDPAALYRHYAGTLLRRLGLALPDTP